jgi:hypothetical protein
VIIHEIVGEAQHQGNGRTRSSLVATLCGTAMAMTDLVALGGPFSENVSLELVFGSDRTQVGIIPVAISTVSGMCAVSDGGIGKFCSSWD